MPDRQTGELTAQEAKACVYRAQGKSKSEAVRLAYERPPDDPDRLCEKASRLFGKPQMMARVAELLSAAKVQDLCSIGQWGQMVMDGIEKAWTDGNMTAYFNGTRQLGQSVGTLKDTMSMTIESRTDDDSLIDKMAGKDKAKLAVLKQLLGAPEGFDQASVPDHETVQ